MYGTDRLPEYLENPTPEEEKALMEEQLLRVKACIQALIDCPTVPGVEYDQFFAIAGAISLHAEVIENQLAGSDEE